MYQEIKQLKIENRTASEERKKEIDARMQEMCEQDPEAFAIAFKESLLETIEDAKQLRIKEQLGDVLQIVSLSYIAKHYFNRSKEWLYQRINGYSVNGKQATFTSEEVEKFNFALQDISKRIGSSSISL